jgi:hypothetical protein
MLRWWPLKLSPVSHSLAKYFRDVFGPIFLKDSNEIVRHLDQACERNLVIDLQELLLLSTADGFVKLAMGVDIGALEVPYNVVKKVDARGNAYEVYKLPSVPFADAYDTSTSIIALRGLDPFWVTSELKDDRRKRLDAAMDVINRFAHGVVAQKKAAVAKKVAAGEKAGREGDILDMFMNLRDDDGKEFDDEYLRDVVVNFSESGACVSMVVPDGVHLCSPCWTGHDCTNPFLDLLGARTEQGHREKGSGGDQGCCWRPGHQLRNDEGPEAVHGCFQWLVRPRE